MTRFFPEPKVALTKDLVYIRVDMVGTNRDKVLTLWRHMPMGQFRANTYFFDTAYFHLLLGLRSFQKSELSRIKKILTWNIPIGICLHSVHFVVIRSEHVHPSTYIDVKNSQKYSKFQNYIQFLHSRKYFVYSHNILVMISRGPLTLNLSTYQSGPFNFKFIYLSGCKIIEEILCR